MRQLKKFGILIALIILYFSQCGLLALAQTVAPYLEFDLHSWAPFGPTYSSVTTHTVVHSLAVDPNNADVMYAGLTIHGLHKTTDGGQTWALTNLGFPTAGAFPIRSVLIDRTNSNVLYTGSLGDVYKSTDGAAHWQESSQGLPPSDDAPLLVSSPQDSNVIYVATNGTVYRSVNAGASWQVAKSGISVPGRSRALAVGPDGALYVGYTAATVYTGSRLWKSTDSAQSWRAIEGGFPPVDVASIAVDPQDPESVYVGTVGQGVYKTTDGGQSWQARFASTSEQSSHDVVVLAVDPLNTGTVYAATADELPVESPTYALYKSVDGGANWMMIKKGVTFKLLVPDPHRAGTLYAGDLLGLYKTTCPVASFSLPVTISPQPDWNWTMAVSAMDREGNIHVAMVGWFPEPGAPWNLASEVFYTTNAGGSFSTPLRLPTASIPPDATSLHSGYYSRYPAIAVDSQGHVHIAYQRTLNGNDPSGLLCYTNNASGSFETPLSSFRYADHSIADRAGEPTIAIDGLDRVHLAVDGMGSQAWYTVGASGVFPDLRPLESGAYHGLLNPVLRADPAGFIHLAAWGQDTAGSQVLLYANNLASSALSEPSLVHTPTPPIVVGTTDMDIDSQGVAHIVFRQDHDRWVWYVNNSAGSFGTPVKAERGEMMGDIEIGFQGVPYLAYEADGYPSYYGLLGFAALTDPLGEMSLPLATFPFGSTPSNGGWFQADEQSSLLHLVYNVKEGLSFETRNYVVYVQGWVCNCAISDREAAFRVDGGRGVLSLEAPAGCPWLATTTADWITLTVASSAGSGSVEYKVARNSTGRSRSGKVIVGGQTLVVHQSAGYWSPGRSRYRERVR